MRTPFRWQARWQARQCACAEQSEVRTEVLVPNTLFDSLIQTFKRLLDLGFTIYKRSLKASLENKFSSSAYNGKVAIMVRIISGVCLLGV